MPQKKLRYSEFAHRINVDAFEEAIGFEPISEHNGNDVGFCLWPENHSNGDTTGKFGIHRDEKLFNCYVCGGGDLLSLAMLVTDLGVEQATSWIYQFCEEDLRSDEQFVDEFLDTFRDVEKRVETLPYFNERVLDQHDEYPPDWWLFERGINRKTSYIYGLRYNEKMYRGNPQSGRFADDGPYEGPAVIIPHYWHDRLVGWQCRWLEDDRPEWVPKYTMTTDFPKENTIWGYSRATLAEGPVLVTESVPSALYALSNNIPAVATFGSSINPAQMRLLRRFAGGVVLAVDNDSAGEKWAKQLTDYLKRYVTVWQLPRVEGGGSDFGDIAIDDMDEYLDLAYEPGVDDLD